MRPDSPNDRTPAWPIALRRALSRARGALLLERLLVALTLPLSVAALLLALALFGLWLALPPPWGFFASLLGLLALVVSVTPLVRLAWPETVEAARRVEEDSAFRHQPIAALGDRPAGDGDPLARALWAEHVRRAEAALNAARARAPRPRVPAADPYALRVVPVLLLIVAIGFAGDDWPRRLSAFVMPPLQAGPERIARIDAWITPPVYTGAPPVLLTGDGTAEATRLATTIPSGSRLTVRVDRADDEEVAVTLTPREGAEVPLAPEASDAAAGISEYQANIGGDVEAAIALDGETRHRWSFAVTPDAVPTIAFTRDPGPAASGALSLAYRVEDDYGVIGAEARFQAVETQDRPGARPLVGVPDFPLALPRARMTSGEGETTRDLLAHPWAGAEVELTLAARDEAGQTGLSQPQRFRLPERRFSNPLARALVEERRHLALDANAAGRVAAALDALAIAPERFGTPTNHYLALRSAYWRLNRARDDEALREVVDYLWEIALAIEDGNLSLAQQRLRDAQEALMRALEEGATDEELQRLMEELRQAMNEFMQELARNLENMPAVPQDLARQMQSVTPQDLNRMMDQIENLARQGARDAARQMLSQMQQMMENLQNAQRMPNQEGGDALSQSMQELQELIQRQQELRDQTYQFGRGQQEGQQGEGQQGQHGQGQQGEGQLGALQQGQQGVREALEALLEQLRGMGMDPNQALDRAGEAMGQAEGSLGEGQTGQALGEQGEALQRLRQGTRSMVEQMMQALGQGQQGQQGPGQQGRDPLGRPYRTEGPDPGNTVKVPDEIDMERARRVLQELRRRLSEPNRPQIERDYLERLLTPF